jgi:hypothetical protein
MNFRRGAFLATKEGCGEVEFERLEASSRPAFEPSSDGTLEDVHLQNVSPA